MLSPEFSKKGRYTFFKLTQLISPLHGSAGWNFKFTRKVFNKVQLIDKFLLQVRDCIAHDGNRNNSVILTDNNGCVLKKKLMGPWQKTRQTGNAEVNLLAFAFFQVSYIS